MILPPRIISRTNASTVFEAVNSADPAWNAQTIKDWPTEVDCLLVDDAPDGCGAMRRYKSATACYLDDPRILYEPFPTCYAHSLFNIGKSCMSTGEVVGHTHAVCYIFGLDHRRKALWGALQHLVASELIVIPGKPPAELSDHVKAVIDQTILRTLEITRARAGGDHVSSKELLKTIAPLKTFINGDIRVPVVQHYCDGSCCAGEDAESLRSAQASDVFETLSANDTLATRK